MGAPVLVVGALGNVGRAVVTSLRERGMPVRAGDLDPTRVHDQLPGIDAVALDLTDPTTFRGALEGAGALFLLRPPPISRVGPTLNALVDEAVRQQVEHVVFSSVAGADTNRIVPHYRVETHLQASGLPWTILRPGFFAQNLGGPYRADIRDHDRVVVPAGDGRVAFVDVRDLGELAADVFAGPAAHAGRGYHLTGPEALTFHEVAALLADALGRPVTYEPASVLGYLAHLGSQGLPIPQRVVQTLLHVGLRRGDAEQVDPTLARLLGRRPRDLATYVHDHAHLWRRSS